MSDPSDEVLAAINDAEDYEFVFRSAPSGGRPTPEAAEKQERPGQPGKNEGERAGLVGRDPYWSPSSPPTPNASGCLCGTCEPDALVYEDDEPAPRPAAVTDLRERLGALLAKWDEDVKGYPKNALGGYARAAVRCCARELRAALAEPGDTP